MQQNRTIYCLGEAIYDIIMKDGKPIDGKVGGALLNTAVSLGRLGIPTSYIGDTGDDAIGDLMKNFLISNNVEVENFIKYVGSRSRLALAFIDDRNHPKYIFYKLDNAEKVNLKTPEIKEGDILIFGSFFGIKEALRESLVSFLREARKAGAIIIYDPNFRPNHLPLLEKVKPYIEENIRLSHITKGSDDDFRMIFGTNSFEETLEEIAAFAPAHFFYTANRNGIWYKTSNKTGHYVTQEIEPLSAVGAGDAFNAGIAFSLFALDSNPQDLNQTIDSNVEKIVETADLFAKDVCLSFENYIGEKIIREYSAL